MTDFEDDNHNHSQHHDQESCNLIINYLPPEFDDNDLKVHLVTHNLNSDISCLYVFVYIGTIS